MKVTTQSHVGLFADCSREEFDRRTARLRGNTTRLQPGMVLTIEPFFFHDGRYPPGEVPGTYGCEDVILVTDAGHEALTQDSLISRDLWVV